VLIWLISAIFGGLLFTLSQNSFAQSLNSPAQESHKKINSDALLRPKLRPGLFRYNVTWEGLPVASASLQIEVAKQNSNSAGLTVKAKAKSAALIDLIYKLRYLAQGLIDLESFKPSSALIDQSENSKRKVTNILFDSDGNATSEIKNIKKNQSSYYKASAINNQLFDPFSAALYSRSLEWEPGQSRHFEVFNGKTKYKITFKCLRREFRYVLGEKKPVLVFTPVVYDLNRKENAQKLRKAELTITDDAYRDLVELDSEVFIGSVRASLDSFTPS
jgi:hypothetical protein